MESHILDEQLAGVSFVDPQVDNKHYKRCIAIALYTMHSSSTFDNTAMSDILAECKKDQHVGCADNWGQMLYEDAMDNLKAVPLGTKLTWGKIDHFMMHTDDDESDAEEIAEEPSAPDTKLPSLSDIQDKVLKSYVVTKSVEDMSKMTMKNVYAYLVQSMAPSAVEILNTVLGATQADRSAVMWALQMSRASMMTAAFTGDDIKYAKSIPESDRMNPYEFTDILADTIVTRVLASKTSLMYMDPGEKSPQVAVCRLGAVISHTKHNVAFGVEENRYQLKIFCDYFGTKHPDVVERVKQKMAYLPVSSVHGCFMKYRPKKQIAEDKDRRADSNRFDVVVRKHGSYPDVPQLNTASIDMQILGTVAVAPSPVALLSVMTHAPNTNKALGSFSKTVEKHLDKVEFEKVDNFYKLCGRCVTRDYSPDGILFFPPTELNESFAASLLSDVIPVVAKDKGIYNNLMRVMNPFGSITLQIACALYSANSLFALSNWLSYCSGDVAQQLGLKLTASDNLAAINRHGDHEPIASGAPRVLTRGVSRTSKSVDYEVPIIKEEFLSDKDGPLLSLIDLSFNGRLFSATNEANYSRHKAAGRNTKMDYFVYDYPEMKYSAAALIKATMADKKSPVKVEALWQKFVVVYPVRLLTPKFVKMLTQVYHLSYCLGNTGMNFSVYLIGVAVATPVQTKISGVFGHWCATSILGRLQLYNDLYQGYPVAVDSIVAAQHSYLNSAGYVKAKCGMIKDDDFLAMFARQRTVTDMNVVKTYSATVDMSNLSDTVDDDNSDVVGVIWGTI